MSKKIRPLKFREYSDVGEPILREQKLKVSDSAVWEQERPGQVKSCIEFRDCSDNNIKRIA